MKRIIRAFTWAFAFVCLFTTTAHAADCALQSSGWYTFNGDPNAYDYQFDATLRQNVTTGKRSSSITFTSVSQTWFNPNLGDEGVLFFVPPTLGNPTGIGWFTPNDVEPVFSGSMTPAPALSLLDGTVIVDSARKGTPILASTSGSQPASETTVVQLFPPATHIIQSQPTPVLAVQPANDPELTARVLCQGQSATVGTMSCYTEVPTTDTSVVIQNADNLISLSCEAYHGWTNGFESIRSRLNKETFIF